MQLVQGVELELVEVPEGLAKLVADLLRGLGGEKLLQVLAREPIHRKVTGRR